MKFQKLFANLRRFVCVCVLSSIRYSSSFAADQVVTISTGEWAPFVSESMPGFGIGPSIVTAAFSEVGFKVEYTFFPWARAMKEVEDGNADLSGFWFFTEERSEKFRYTDSMVDSPNVFFYLGEKPFDWASYSDLNNKTIGTTLGYSYSEEFDNAVKENQIKTEVEETDILNFRKLLRGRIDAFPIAELVGYDLIKSEFSRAEIKSLKAHPKKISSSPLHLITSLESPRSIQLAVEFNRGLKILSDNGKLQSILNSYK